MLKCGPDCWCACNSCKHFNGTEESDKWGKCTLHARSSAIFETCDDFHCRHAPAVPEVYDSEG